MDNLDVTEEQLKEIEDNLTNDMLLECRAMAAIEGNELSEKALKRYLNHKKYCVYIASLASKLISNVVGPGFTRKNIDLDDNNLFMRMFSDFITFSVNEHPTMQEGGNEVEINITVTLKESPPK